MVHSSSNSEIIGSTIGLFPITPIPITPVPYVAIIGMRLIINMMWGIVLVSIFLGVYNLIPGKGVLKGLYYGLLFFLVGSFRMSMYWFGWENLALTWRTGFIGFLGSGIAFGLVLGLLYRRPTEAIAVKKEKPTKGICKYCGAKIPKGFVFCGKCGKKQ